jgi:hypothetical protein
MTHIPRTDSVHPWVVNFAPRGEIKKTGFNHIIAAVLGLTPEGSFLEGARQKLCA